MTTTPRSDIHAPPDLSDVGLAAGAPAPLGVSQCISWAFPSQSEGGDEKRQDLLPRNAVNLSEMRQEIVPWAYMDEEGDADVALVPVSIMTRIGVNRADPRQRVKADSSA